MADEGVNNLSGMTKEEEEEYREAFGMFDINGDGAWLVGWFVRSFVVVT